jgi:hypothetical protein
MHLLCLEDPYARVFHEEPTMSLKRVMEADEGDAASRQLSHSRAVLVGPRGLVEKAGKCRWW